MLAPGVEGRCAELPARLRDLSTCEDEAAKHVEAGEERVDANIGSDVPESSLDQRREASLAAHTPDCIDPTSLDHDSQLRPSLPHLPMRTRARAVQEVTRSSGDTDAVSLEHKAPHSTVGTPSLPDGREPTGKAPEPSQSQINLISPPTSSPNGHPRAFDSDPSEPAQTASSRPAADLHLGILEPVSGVHLNTLARLGRAANSDGTAQTAVAHPPQYEHLSDLNARGQETLTLTSKRSGSRHGIRVPQGSEVHISTTLPEAIELNAFAAGGMLEDGMRSQCDAGYKADGRDS